MTNRMIILMESVKLMEAGVIKGTGEKIVVELSEGEKKELEIPEAIHTYQGWKSLGYHVKRGQKAVAQFPVWKFMGGIKELKEKEVGEDVNVDTNENKGYCFMKLASFFTKSQVEADVIAHIEQEEQ